MIMLSLFAVVGSIGGVVVAIIFILLVMVLCYLGRYKLKIIKKPDRNRPRVSTISNNTELPDIPDVADRNRAYSGESSNSTRPDIVGDLPPSYHSVVDNPVFVMNATPLNGESDDALPTYEEATLKNHVKNSSISKPVSDKGTQTTIH